jgi:hypothetical protein
MKLLLVAAISLFLAEALAPAFAGSGQTCTSTCSGPPGQRTCTRSCY